MTITQAAQQLTGTAWNLRGDKLEQADDGTPRVEAPSQAELQACMDAIRYREQRATQYPAIGDQLDALWKIVTNAPDEQSEAIASQIQAVKAQFPKPQ